MGGINHRTDIVQVLCHAAVVLTHGGRVLLAPDDGPEHIGGHEQPLCRQLVIGIGDKLHNRLGLVTSLGIRLIVHHIPHGAVHRKADIVKLDLLKSDLPSLPRHLDQVVPNLLLIRVHPGKALAVPVDASVRLVEAPLWLLLCQIGVPEGHHPGNRIDPVLLKLGNQPRHVPYECLNRSDLIHRRRIHREGDPSLVVLYINHNRVQLRGIDLLNDRVHPILCARHIG